MLLLIIIVITTYALMHAIEMASFGLRAAGRITNRVALGTTLSRSFYTVSDLFKIIFLPSLAFIVEFGITINDYLILVIAAFIATFIASIVIIIRLNSLQKFYQVVFHKYSEDTTPMSLFTSFVNKNN